MKNAIWYKDCWLMPGSQAHRLHTERKFKELDAHMAELERKRRERGEV